MLDFRNILVHYDSRRKTHPGLEYAAGLAEATDGRLKIVTMIADFSWLARRLIGGYERVVENITQAKSQEVGQAAAPLRDKGIDVTTKVLDGRTSIALIREVLKDQHDVVVKEAKGPQSRGPGFFGATATQLLRKCPCPSSRIILPAFSGSSLQ